MRHLDLIQYGMSAGVDVFKCFFMAKQYSAVYVHRGFFIHSSTGGHSGCFQTLAAVNSSAVDRRVHGFFQISARVALDKFPEVELLLHL